MIKLLKCVDWRGPFVLGTLILLACAWVIVATRCELLRPGETETIGLGQCISVPDLDLEIVIKSVNGTAHVVFRIPQGIATQDLADGDLWQIQGTKIVGYYLNGGLTATYHKEDSQ